ncbi:MAG: ACT domain-containing protein [Actinomycetota bacterium]
MREVVITAVGTDRPGIVASITEALLDLGGNLADCRAALLRGSFAIVVAATLPVDVPEQDLRAALAGRTGDLGLDVWIGPAAAPAHHEPLERCVISVYGADHPGIVAAVSRALADREVNIVDLSSRVVGDPAIYVLGLEVELPRDLDPEGLRRYLEPVARAQGVELSVEAEAEDIL